MKSDDIQSLFTTDLKTYGPVEGQPSDPDLSTLQETLTTLLLTITYDGEKGIHNLVGLIMDEDAYKARHGANFLTPSRPAIYDVDILIDAYNAVRSVARQHTLLKNKIINYLPPLMASQASLSLTLLKIRGCLNYATPIFSTRPSSLQPSCHTSRPCV